MPVEIDQDVDAVVRDALRKDAIIPVIRVSPFGDCRAQPVADGVLPHRPEWVARVSIKHAERLMAEPKSKNYPIAAEWLKRAKKAYRQLGQTQEWKFYLEKVKEKYSRRPALQSRLKDL